MSSNRTGVFHLEGLNRIQQLPSFLKGIIYFLFYSLNRDNLKKKRKLLRFPFFLKKYREQNSKNLHVEMGPVKPT